MITEEDKKYMKQCSRCSSWSPLASEVCSSCGGKEFSKYKAPKKRRQSDRMTAPTAGTRKVCEGCGTSNPEYVRNYCVRCGARL